MFENYKQLERLQNAKASFDVTKWEKGEVKRLRRDVGSGDHLATNSTWRERYSFHCGGHSVRKSCVRRSRLQWPLISPRPGTP